MVVSMQTNNLSSLSPRVTVFDASGHGLAQAVNSNMYGSTATVTISNVSPGQVYYIRLISGNTGPGSVGAYGLLVNFGSQAQAPIPGLVTVVPEQQDQGGGSSGLEAQPDDFWLNLLGDSQSLDEATDGALDTSGTIQVGSIVGQGDALMSGIRAFSRGHRHRHHRPLQ
jgi:hypothetical protein